MLRRLQNRSRAVLNSYRSTVDVLAGAPVELAYVSDGDANGVFYYIGTNGLRDAWTNPHTAGRITASASPSIIQGSIEELVDRTNNTVHTGQNFNSNYFRFDLGASRTLLLKSFSWRQRSDSGDTQPISLYVYGSNDASNWYLINKYNTGSKSVTGYALTGGTASLWNNVTVAAPGTYRYIQFYSNVNNINAGYLTAGEVELYGTLYVT